MNPYGRAFLVEAINLSMYHGHGAPMGIYARLLAKDDASVCVHIHMENLTPQVQQEFLL